MKIILTSTLFFLVNCAIAQEFCFTDHFKTFQKEEKLECKNFVLANLSFINDGHTIYPIGQTAVLDSIAQYFARNEYIYEIDYETNDEKISDAEISHLEKSVRDYLISKNSVNQVKVFQEAHTKVDHTASIPEHMNAAFFFVVIYPNDWTGFPMYPAQGRH